MEGKHLVQGCCSFEFACMDACHASSTSVILSTKLHLWEGPLSTADLQTHASLLHGLKGCADIVQLMGPSGSWKPCRLHYPRSACHSYTWLHELSCTVCTPSSGVLLPCAPCTLSSGGHKMKVGLRARHTGT